jgi:hypothetical protein
MILIWNKGFLSWTGGCGSAESVWFSHPGSPCFSLKNDILVFGTWAPAGTLSFFRGFISFSVEPPRSRIVLNIMVFKLPTFFPDTLSPGTGQHSNSGVTIRGLFFAGRPSNHGKYLTVNNTSVFPKRKEYK